jgi:CheY-like chemotaxis protein
MEKQMDARAAKILVVDDHEEFLQFLGRALTMLGWSVITSSNGGDVLDKLRYIKPSLILMDMQMRGMDGFELTRIVKKDSSCRDILILAVTARNTLENRHLCLEAGCDDVISKPFRVPDLQNRMVRLLSKGEL